MQVQQQIADACAEMMHVKPDQTQGDDLGQRVGNKAFDDGKGLRLLKTALQEP